MPYFLTTANRPKFDLLTKNFAVSVGMSFYVDNINEKPVVVISPSNSALLK